MTTKAEIGERLKVAREFVGLTQEDAARVVGIPRTALSMIETGQRKVDTVELSRLAKLYEQSVESFVGDGDTPPLPENVRALARTASALPASDREELLRFAQYLQSRRGSSDE